MEMSMRDLRSGQGEEGKISELLCWNEGYREARRRDLTQPINFSTRTAPSTEVRMFPFSAWGGGRGKAFKWGLFSSSLVKSDSLFQRMGYNEDQGRSKVRGEGEVTRGWGLGSWKRETVGGRDGSYKPKKKKRRGYCLRVGKGNREEQRTGQGVLKC